MTNLNQFVMGQAETWLHKFKCGRCGLHFVVASWRKDWGLAFCPECGSADRYIHWKQGLSDPVFTLVPGMAGPPFEMKGYD